MPPRVNSRHEFCTAYTGYLGRRALTDRVPYRFVDLQDTIRHVVSQGDTWHSIAGRYYIKLAAGAQLWWAVADFQPEPVVDPTQALVPGVTVYVPSPRTVRERILNTVRRRFF